MTGPDRGEVTGMPLLEEAGMHAALALGTDPSLLSDALVHAALALGAEDGGDRS